MTRIFILDDLNFMRQALQALLESEADLEIVGQANNSTEALEYLEKTEVDIIIVDIEMPEMDGLELTKIISERFPEVKVIIFSSHEDEQSIHTAIEAGAKGYISKNTRTGEIIDTIHNVRRGYFQLGPGLVEKLFSHAIAQQKSFSDQLADMSTKYKEELSQIEEKYTQINTINRQQLFAELDFQMECLKTEFRQGLDIFQDKVNQQIQTGLHEMLTLSQSHDSDCTFRESQQVNSQNQEIHQHLTNLYLTTRKSISNIEHQLCLIRYFVIILGIAYVIEHLSAFIWR